MSPGTSRLVTTTVNIDPDPATAKQPAAAAAQSIIERMMATQIAARDEKANKELAARFDALNQALAAAENVLKNLKPPHGVWTSYGYDESGGFQLLGMVKLNDQWRLVHGWDHEANDTNYITELKPLIERPVEIRVQAALQLQFLKQRIVEAKEQYIPAVDQAILQAQQFVEINTPSKPTKK